MKKVIVSSGRILNAFPRNHKERAYIIFEDISGRKFNINCTKCTRYDNSFFIKTRFAETQIRPDFGTYVKFYENSKTGEYVLMNIMQNSKYVGNK